MISKLAAWGRTRDEAIARMRRALAEYTVGGIKTTLPFFREVVRDEEFIAGRLDTGFIERFNQRRDAAAATAALDARDAEAKEAAGESDTPTRESDTSAADSVRDIAIIAAALAETQNAPATTNGSQRAVAEPPSRWRVAGRTAQQRSRDLF
jgi:acetyl/propionyl-CoA carboxylase alpha subunit